MSSRTKEGATLHVADFFKGRSIFITGGTGFVGKALLCKLLSSPTVGNQLGNVYLLLREKRCQSPQERLTDLLDNPIFESLRKKGKRGLSVVKKVKGMPGDVTLPDLGLSPVNRAHLQNKVSVVFHSAATVKFDAPKVESLEMNVNGTRRVLELAAGMHKLAAFVHDFA